jgi:TusA-related sulfurtransferase
MTRPRSAAVDVRDMLCAQALALVARAAERLGAGQVLVIRYNAADVKRDLLAWARERRHRIEDAGGDALRLLP